MMWLYLALSPSTSLRDTTSSVSSSMLGWILANSCWSINGLKLALGDKEWYFLSSLPFKNSNFSKYLNKHSTHYVAENTSIRRWSLRNTQSLGPSPYQNIWHPWQESVTVWFSFPLLTWTWLWWHGHISAIYAWLEIVSALFLTGSTFCC